MVKVTEVDRDFAAPWISQGAYQTLSARSEYRKEIESGKHDAHPMVIAAAAHREAAAKAERDRCEKIARDYAAKAVGRGWVTNPESAAMAAKHIATAIKSDALESQHD